MSLSFAAPPPSPPREEIAARLDGHNQHVRQPELGDTVRIARTPDTIEAGYADRTGKCYGFTTPSATRVSVVGPTQADYALNVRFDDGTSAWFDASLVAFVDVDPGQTLRIGEKWFVRTPDGDWIESSDPN